MYVTTKSQVVITLQLFYFFCRNIGTFGSIINTELAWLAAAYLRLIEGMAFLNETNYEEDLMSLAV